MRYLSVPQASQIIQHINMVSPAQKPKPIITPYSSQKPIYKFEKIQRLLFLGDQSNTWYHQSSYRTVYLRRHHQSLALENLHNLRHYTDALGRHITDLHNLRQGFWHVHSHFEHDLSYQQLQPGFDFPVIIHLDNR